MIKEKELTRLRDQLSTERREFPWVKIEKNYIFDGPSGKETLADLFDGHSQLIIYHFMFGPAWKEGCHGCSFLADHIDGANLHLMHHDVSLVVVSRAPLPEFEAFKRRMGWRFKWVSSYGSDFNYDYHVSFTKDDLARAWLTTTSKGAKTRAKKCPASVCSTRTRLATSSTPILLMLVGWTYCSARTTISTLRRKVATRPPPWTGYDITTDTTPPSSRRSTTLERSSLLGNREIAASGAVGVGTQ